MMDAPCVSTCVFSFKLFHPPPRANTLRRATDTLRLVAGGVTSRYAPRTPPKSSETRPRVHPALLPVNPSAHNTLESRELPQPIRQAGCGTAQHCSRPISLLPLLRHPRLHQRCPQRLIHRKSNRALGSLVLPQLITKLLDQRPIHRKDGAMALERGIRH